MEFENLLEPEVAAAAAVAAAIASPQVRQAMRKGAIYGLAGLIVAGDAVTSFVRGVGRGAQAAAVGVSLNANGGHDGGHNQAKSEPQAAAEGTGE